MNDSTRRFSSLPPLWIGLALVFWGIATEHPLLGCGLAITVEAGRFMPVRWDLTARHFYRVADFTSVFFALIAVYQFNEHSIYAIYRILPLMPVCLFPLIIAERYSTQAAVPLSAFFLSLRRRIDRGLEHERYYNVEFPYLVVCIIGASATNISETFYLCVAFALCIGALFKHRPGRFHPGIWICAAIGAAALALSLQLSVKFAQSELEDSLSYWFNQFSWHRTDPEREQTSIGAIGRLKLSDRIRIRVDAPLSTPLPIRLREASYTDFNLGTWSVSESKLSVIDAESEEPRWLLRKQDTNRTLRTARIVTTHAVEVSVIPMPYGTTQIAGAELIEVQQNQFGTTLVEGLPGQLKYDVQWTNMHLDLGAATPSDLVVPDNYLATIDQIANEINLTDLQNEMVIQRVERFFREKFKYSLIQKGYYPGRTPLSHFLLQDRKGHCEFFATATTLLLRYAGIPARYAVGYVADEYSPLEGAFVVRARHAHSWVEAYVEGRWIVVDTTPSEWYALESARVSQWQRVQDLLSWASNRLKRYQRRDDTPIADSLIWLVPPLSLWLLWRMRSRLKSVVTLSARAENTPQRGADSELYRLAEVLVERGFELAPGDTLATYLRRHVKRTMSGTSLERILELHYQYRFANRGITPAQRNELRDGGREYYREYTGS